MIATRAHGTIYKRRTHQLVRTRAGRRLASAAGYIRTVARRSIKRIKRPAPSESPIHSPTGLAKRRDVIQFSVDEINLNAVIGPRYSRFGDTMRYHEFGKPRFRRRYPKRPVMGPALTTSLPKIPPHWRASIST